MADAAPVVHIGENSTEHVALKLLEVVARLEQKSLSGTEAGSLKAGWVKGDRKYVLDTYSECLQAAKGYRSVK